MPRQLWRQSAQRIIKRNHCTLGLVERNYEEIMLPSPVEMVDIHRFAGEKPSEEYRLITARFDAETELDTSPYP